MLNRFALSPPRFAKTVLRTTPLLLLSGIMALWPGTAPIAQGQDPLPETRVRLGMHVYTLEQATTPEQLAQGLMHRPRLPAGHGMLFAFPSPTEARFWMKNTLIPLDMLFLSGGRVVFIQRAAPPCPATLGDSCPTYGPDRRVDQVIELPAGTARAHGLRPGVRMVRLPADLPSPATSLKTSSSSLKTQTGTPDQAPKPGERHRR